MAEHGKEPDNEGEPSFGEANPAAVSLALSRASRNNKALDTKVAAFLDEQTDLTRIQKEHLHEQRELQVSLLRWRRLGHRMTVALQLMTAAVGLAVAVALAVLAWNASQSHGLVVEAFSVPPDLAQRGLTGQVVAAKMLDELSAMQAKTHTLRPAQSYQNNWGDDLKLQIPETGVSIGELDRSLRRWLGHETHVSGEVYRIANGLTVTARAGEAPGGAYSGADVGLDHLLQQAAESVYRRTQPYRYAYYLYEQGRDEEALPVTAALADGPPGEDRAWADILLACLEFSRDRQDALARAEESRRLRPDDPSSGGIYQLIQRAVGHDEAAIRTVQKALDHVPPGLDGESLLLWKRRAQVWQAQRAEWLGDSQTAAPIWESGARNSLFNSVRLAETAIDHARGHDAPGADRALARNRTEHDDLFFRQLIGGSSPLAGGSIEAVDARFASQVELAVDVGLERWPAANRAGAEWAAVRTPDRRPGQLVVQEMNMPDPTAAYAYAKAMTGDLAGARALIAATALDCYSCVDMRGRIEAVARDWPLAQRWFAEAARQAPSSPFAWSHWGEMLAAKGDLDGATAKFEIAHQKGPRFADPLKAWADVLARRGQWRAAVAKYDEALQYAPAWPELRTAREAAVRRAG